MPWVTGPCGALDSQHAEIRPRDQLIRSSRRGDLPRRQPSCSREARIGVGGADLYRPAVQYRDDAEAHAHYGSAQRNGKSQRLWRRALREQRVASPTYADTFDDYLAFLRPRLIEAHRLLTPTGSLFLHLDPREVHYAKVMLDQIFGRDCFRNEIIWAYDYGGKPRDRWPAKHDNILWYSRSAARTTPFNYDAIDRVPYMAPELVGPEKAARGKIPTDVWWITVVPTNSREKTGYPTQKPLKLLERIVRVHSNPGDLVLGLLRRQRDAQAQAAANLGRRFLLIDSSRDAVRVMRKRLDCANRGSALIANAGSWSGRRRAKASDYAAFPARPLRHLPLQRHSSVD